MDMQLHYPNAFNIDAVRLGLPFVLLILCSRARMQLELSEKHIRKLLVLFNALEIARYFMELFGPYQTLELVKDFNKIVDMGEGVERGLVLLHPSRSEPEEIADPLIPHGEMFDRTFLLDPFSYRIVRNRVDEELLFLFEAVGSWVAPIDKLAALEGPRDDDSIYSSSTGSSGSSDLNLDFEFSRLSKHHSMTTEESEVVTPKPVHKATMEYDADTEATPRPRLRARKPVVCLPRVAPLRVKPRLHGTPWAPLVPRRLCIVPTPFGTESPKAMEIEETGIDPREASCNETGSLDGVMLGRSHISTYSDDVEAELNALEENSSVEDLPARRLTIHANTPIEDLRELAIDMVEPQLAHFYDSRSIHADIGRVPNPSKPKGLGLPQVFNPLVSKPVQPIVESPKDNTTQFTKAKPPKKSLLNRLNPLKHLTRRFKK